MSVIRSTERHSLMRRAEAAVPHDYDERSRCRLGEARAGRGADGHGEQDRHEASRHGTVTAHRRELSHGRLRVVLDVAANLLRALDGLEPCDEVQRHVDPGRDAGGRDDLAGRRRSAPPGRRRRRGRRAGRARPSASSRGRPSRSPGLAVHERARCRRSSSASRTRRGRAFARGSSRPPAAGACRRREARAGRAFRRPPTSSPGRPSGRASSAPHPAEAATVRTLIGLSLIRAQAVRTS